MTGQTATTVTEGNGNKPIWKISMKGLLSVSCFENKVETKEGKTFNSRTYVLNRRYRDDSGNYHSTKTLRESDLPRAIVALQEAYKRVAVFDPDVESGNGEVLE